MKFKRNAPVTQLCRAITVPVTPAFKSAAQRGAARRQLTVAEFVRLAVSEKLLVDGVRHRRPDGLAAQEVL